MNANEIETMEASEYKIMYDIESTYWWFRGKQFLIDMLLSNHLKEDRSNRALDIGAGTGFTLELLQRYGTAYGVELSTVAIHMLRQRGLNFIVRSDADEPIPFKSDAFSAVTCLDVLEHLENDSGLLEEMVRVCKPGGIIFITVPAMPFLWSRHDEALHHKRRYIKKQLLNQIAPFKCSVIKVSYFNASLFAPIAAVRKLKSYWKEDKEAKSDFFMPLPGWVNRVLSFLYTTELKFLRIANFPFGVSIMLIVQKPKVG